MNVSLMHPNPQPESIVGVWRASALSPVSASTLASGHAALDHELPGQGWPLGQLIELLQAQPGLHEWRLLLPALCLASLNGPLVLIGAPHLPHLPALCSAGIDAAQVLRVEVQKPAERLWAAEQALRCGELGALLAWLPQARAEQLRRLQLAAHAAPDRLPLVFVMRPLDSQHASSPAPLRLSVHAAQRGLSVQILKRRGPTMDHALWLAAPLPVMAILRREHAELQDHDHVVDRPEPERAQRRLHLAA